MIAFLWAIHVQSKIEKEYSFRIEILLVSITWFLFSNVQAASWLVGKNFLDLDNWDSDESMLTLN
jgi:hypothetical protein